MLRFRMVVAMLASLSSPFVASDSVTQAAAFARQLAAQSPQHDGVPLRSYVLKDLDHDNRFEVLEYVSAYENAAGFMNVELAGAFEWVNIYEFHDGEYRDRTGSYDGFLIERKCHYQFWLRVFDEPSVLSDDSRELVRENGAQFRSVLRGFLQRIEELK